MTRPLITFTTDFGVGSPYIAEMKGVAFSLCRDACLVDITHAVPPQDIRYGAFYLDQIVASFPAGTIHVAVVDPGVGTHRKVVVARIAHQLFIAPDNGLLSRVAASHGVEELVHATNRQYWRHVISHTFHGRDIMTPLAAHLASGVSLHEFGPPLEHVVELDWPEPTLTAGHIRGEVQVVDSFGNLISNIHQSMLAGKHVAQIRCRSEAIEGVSETYAKGQPGELVALIGSSGWIEIAEVEGNAARKMNAKAGETIYVTLQ